MVEAPHFPTNASSTLISISPNIAEGDFSFWGLLGAMAEGAFSYMGGKAMKDVMEEKPGNYPTTLELLDAIVASVRELEKFFSKELRKILTEDHLKELRGKCSAANTDLSRYGGLLDSDKHKYKYLIEHSDTYTSEGIALCEEWQPLSLPTFAAFVSLRSITIRAFYEIDGVKKAYHNYADELEKYKKFIDQKLKDYLQTLDPDTRAGPVTCEVLKNTGGGFHTRIYECKFSVDGEDQPAIGGISVNGQNDDGFRDQAISSRNAKVSELTKFRDETIKNFQEPLLKIAQTWQLTADKIRKSK